LRAGVIATVVAGAVWYVGIGLGTLIFEPDPIGARLGFLAFYLVLIPLYSVMIGLPIALPIGVASAAIFEPSVAIDAREQRAWSSARRSPRLWEVRRCWIDCGPTFGGQSPSESGFGLIPRSTSRVEPRSRGLAERGDSGPHRA